MMDERNFEFQSYFDISVFWHKMIIKVGFNSIVFFNWIKSKELLVAHLPCGFHTTSRCKSTWKSLQKKLNWFYFWLIDVWIHWIKRTVKGELERIIDRQVQQKRHEAQFDVTQNTSFGFQIEITRWTRKKFHHFFHFKDAA